MKLIAFRMSDDEKARLEQMAEARKVTVSRALREGALLYLKDTHGSLHRALGGDTTFHGLRRDKIGRTLTASSEPTKGEARAVASMRTSVQTRGLGAIREAWDRREDARVVLAALGQWLDLVGEVYVSSGDQMGWEWFLRDYCVGYTEPQAREGLCKAVQGALIREPTIDIGAVLQSLDGGMTRLLRDAERQYLVRRAILASWKGLARRVAE
jgi:hypothetical protein